MQYAILAFLKKPTTIVGIVTALMFQLIFSVIWMTGYDGVTDRVKDFKIDVVNESTDIGQKIVDNLQKIVPFQMETSDSLAIARERLENREIQMVVHIPSNFQQQLQQADGKATLTYMINESNPAMVKSVMQSVAANITGEVNKESIKQGLQVVFAKAQLPTAQVQGMAEGFSEMVISDVKRVYPVDHFATQMVPMMVLLASYVGAMIMCMNIQQSAVAIGSKIGKWQQFLARGFINIVASVVIALVGTSLITLLGGGFAQGFVTIWLYLTLIVMTFLFVAQIFLLLLGPAGMLFNIIMLSVQLVTSGAMVPRELLSSFYYGISNYFPATYAVEGLMNVLFGGPSLVNDARSLVWIMLASILIGVGIVALKKQRAVQPADRLVRGNQNAS